MKLVCTVPHGLSRTHKTTACVNKCFPHIFAPWHKNRQHVVHLKKKKRQKTAAWVEGVWSRTWIWKYRGKVLEPDIQVVFCHEAITGPQKLYRSTIPLVASGCRGGFRVRSLVWTAWHTTSSKWGIFLEVFFFSFVLWWIWKWVWSDLIYLLGFALVCEMFKHMTARPGSTVLLGPLYRGSTISPSGPSDCVLSSSPSQTTVWCWIPKEPSPKKNHFFFSSKKIHERLPP